MDLVPPEKDRLRMFVLYDHPLDYPRHYVVREWFYLQGESWPARVAYLFARLEDAREFIPPGLVRIQPQPGEDPVIIETWI